MSIANNLEKIFSLEGKIVLLTGATGGIGEALARGLAGAGAKMALCDLNMETLAKVESTITGAGGVARSYGLDIMSIDNIRVCVDKVVADYGRIDVLVNCAGINKREGFLDVLEETYDRIMDINLKGLYFLSQEVAKHMFKRKQGNIINIGSHNDEGMLGGCSVYGATKSGLRGLTRSMAVEWAKHGIRANMLSPGHIRTPLTNVTWEHPTRSTFLLDRIAMRRAGTPEDLVGMCIMLASDASNYMTGEVYRIDGGYICGGDPWEFDTEYK